MSQINLPDVGNPYSGALNSAFVNAIKAALLSGNSMPQRPDLAAAGLVWSLNVSATERQILLYDGFVDHLIMSVNPATGAILDVNPFSRNASNLNAGTIPTARVPKPTQQQAEAGTDNTKFMTSLRVKQAIAALTSPTTNAGDLISGVLATARVPQATKSQAEGGTDNTKFMTPLRVAEAIATNGAKVLIIRDQKTQNVGSQTFAANVWNTHEYATVRKNTIAGASVVRAIA